jgi:hypothetical protein
MRDHLGAHSAFRSVLSHTVVLMRGVSFSRSLALTGSLLAALSVAPGVMAQSTPSPEDMAAARTLGTEGVKAADSGDCAGAIPKLAAAEKLFHAPTTLDRLGECEIKVGKLVAGTEHLNRVVREQLAPNAPAAFVTAQKRAQDALGPALPRIAKLKIHVDGVPADKVTATVDGAPVLNALFDAGRPTDPGNHDVQASAPGFKTASTTVTLKDGGEATASLRLDPDPNATAAAAAAPAPAPAPGAEPAAGQPAGAPAPQAATQPAPGGEQKAPLPVAAIALMAAGGVGIVVGSVFGVMALGNKSTLDNNCGPTKKTCPSQGDIDSLNTNAWVSNIGFGVGIVGLAVGGILLATNHPSQKTGSSHPEVHPLIGIGTAGVGGSF